MLFALLQVIDFEGKGRQQIRIVQLITPISGSNFFASRYLHSGTLRIMGFIVGNNSQQSALVIAMTQVLVVSE